MHKRRVLIVGVGSIGERHLRCFGLTGRCEMGFCETNERLRRDVAGRYDVTGAYASLDDALEQSWDAAVICTPAPVHIPIAERLAKAGVHLLVEKPLSTSTQGIADLIRTVADKALVASVAYPYRSHPGLGAMRDLIASGRLGKPMQIVVQAGQNFPFFRPAYREIYYTDRAKGGGAIQDALTHLLDAGQWLVGPISRVTADAAHMVLEGTTVEDTAHLIVRHGSVMGVYSISQFQYFNESMITVNCDRGSARFSVMQGSWQWVDEIHGTWHQEPWNPMERDDLFKIQANLFLDTVDGLRPPGCTLEQGLQTLKVNLAALRSADAGGVGVDIADIH
jgi:predicted dehydrogenase